MPIVKVEQKQRFGIVSLSRVDQLLALNKKKLDETIERPQASPPRHIDQAFVAKYNSKPVEARDSMNVEIWKALQHAKYKAGLSHASTSSSPTPPTSDVGDEKPSVFDVTPYDTSIAWLELTQLCQCNGPLQQDILLTLCVSLNRSPISTAHIPSLVYVAGLCLQWLKEDVITQEQQLLRTGELLLLRILYLISLRLYYHHLTGFLLDSITKDEIRQLKFDIEGFENREKAYRGLPEALLHWKIALEIGLIICEQSTKSARDSGSGSRSSSAPFFCKSETNAAASESASSPGTSHGGTNLSPILWHSLDIWQCTKQRSDVLPEAIQDLLACSTEFSTEQWMEGTLAMSILCSTSQLSLDVLNLVQQLAKGKCEGPEDSPHQQMAAVHLGSKKQESTTTAQHPPTIIVKDTRFTLPVKADSNTLGDTKTPVASSKANNVATLNVLGMQPDFDEAESGSFFTIDQTVAFSEMKKETNLGLPRGTTKAASADDIRFMQTRISNQALPKDMLAHSMTVSSVGTQSLIANESIPDPLPSAEVSNVTFLNSITTIDPGESLGKSVGLLTSSNSKNLDFSISNLVSPGLVPSGELTSKGFLATSDSPVLKESDVGLSTNDPMDAHKNTTGKKGMEVNWESHDRVRLFHDQYSTTHTEDSQPQHPTTEENLPVQPQDVRVIEATPSDMEERPDSRITHFTHSTAPLAGGANMLSSQVHPSTVLRHSTFSSNTSVKIKDHKGFESWPTEVALTYTLGMASVGMFGITSLIQRMAMEGPVISRGGNYGLVDLADYKADVASVESEANNLDWSIRHGAILGLSRVSKTCRSLPMKDGISDLAWWKLVERHKNERDMKVLQAFSVAQVGPDMDEAVMAAGGGSTLYSPLLGYIADGLSELFLPSLSSVHNITKPQGKQSPVKAKSTKGVKVQHKKLQLKSVQSKVKAEIDKPRVSAKPSFNTRTMGALNKIATEDWRRQMAEHDRLETEEGLT